MLTKKRVIGALDKLPESFSIDKLVDQLVFIEKIEEGIRHSGEGKTLPDEEIKGFIDKR